MSKSEKFWDKRSKEYDKNEKKFEQEDLQETHHQPILL